MNHPRTARLRWMPRPVAAVAVLPLLLALLAPLAIASEPEVAWAGAFGDLGVSRTDAVAVDAAGNVYLTGAFAGTVDFDPGPTLFTRTAQGGSDIFVVKLDAAGALVWARVFFGQGTNEGLAIAVDAQGNVYTTGRFAGQADFDPAVTVFALTPPGGQGIFVSKLDTDGNFVWANAMGGGNSVNDTGYGIAVDSAGNVLTTGAFSGLTDFDTGPVGHIVAAQGEEDIFIRKLDPDGNFLWVRTFQGFSVGGPRAITVDRGGNIYTTGRFQGTFDFDPGVVGFPITAAGDDTAGAGDAFVSKLDANGDFVWAAAFGGFGANAEGGAIAVDESGAVAVTGRFHGIVDFDPGQGIASMTSGILGDAFVAKLTAGGELAWVRGIGNNDVQQGHGITVDSEGAIYTAGEFQGTVDFDPGPDSLLATAPPGGRSAFVWKLNRHGNLEWARAAGGPGVSAAYGIALDAGGDIVAAGAFTDTVDFQPGPNPFPLTAATSGLASYFLKLSEGGAVVKGLTGTIRHAVTNARLACAVVELQGSGDESLVAVIDAAGEYFFAPLPPGEYAVRVMAPGFEVLMPESITVVPFEPDTIDFALEAAPARPVIQGVITDAGTGERLVAARAVLSVEGTVLAETITCGVGRYEFPVDLLNENGEIDAELSVSLDNYDAETISFSVDTAIGGTVDAALDKQSPGAATLTVRVREASTGPVLPLEDARVTLRGPISVSAATGATGDYTFGELLPGFYTVTASARGFEGQSRRRTLVAGAGLEAVLTLEPGEAAPPAGPADINGDGIVNAVDVQLVINAALGIDIGGFNADVNGDGVVNAVDVQLVINAALGIAID